MVTLQQYPQLYKGTKCTIHVYNLDNDGNEVYKVGNFLKDVLFAIPNSTNILAIKTDASDKDAFDADLHKTVIIDISNNHTVSRNNMNPTHLIHFSCDGQRAIDSTLRVFDIYSGSILQNFHTKYEDIEYKAKYRARITRDGKFAVWVKEQDGTLKVADIDSGNLVAEAFTHATPQSLEVSQDNVIAIGCDDGRIMLLQIWPHDKPGKEHLVYERHVGLLPQHNGRMQMRRALYSKSKCCTVI